MLSNNICWQLSNNQNLTTHWCSAPFLTYDENTLIILDDDKQSKNTTLLIHLHGICADNKFSQSRHEVNTIWRNIKHASCHPILISASGNVSVRCTKHLEHLRISKILVAARKYIWVNTCRTVKRPSGSSGSRRIKTLWSKAEFYLNTTTSREDHNLIFTSWNIMHQLFIFIRHIHT